MGAIFFLEETNSELLKMTIRFSTTSIILLLCLSTQAVMADVLLMDSVKSAPINSEEGMLRPTRNMTMEQVSQRFGQPQTSYPSVGEPPITRWDYGDYSVYFEYNHVLTSVVHH
ncbi:MAG: hypothetical protein P8179_20635 [Candidatus Thiodiazotropha sp.]|jgi:hypothetical protein